MPIYHVRKGWDVLPNPTSGLCCDSHHKVKHWTGRDKGVGQTDTHTEGGGPKVSSGSCHITGLPKGLQGTVVTASGFNHQPSEPTQPGVATRTL